MVCCCCCCCSATAALLLSCGLPILPLPVLLLCVHNSSGRMGVGGRIVVEQRSSRVVVVGGMVVLTIPDTKILCQGHVCVGAGMHVVRNQ